MAARLLDWDQAAEYLGLTRDALRNRVARRQIPHVRDGRLVRFDRQQLDRWIEAHTIEAVR